MKKMILTPRGLRKKLEILTGYSRPTIIKYLNGRYNEKDAEENERATQVRSLALAHGGILSK